MRNYSLNDYNLISKNNFNYKLPKETILIIDNLSDLVGSPEYIKTPQFNKNKNVNNRRKKKVTDIDDNDWQTIRTFQATELNKQNKVSSQFDIIRKNLNMLTANTYIKLIDNILHEINEYLNGEKNNEDDILNFIGGIFKMISTNILYSDTYAMVYKNIIDKFPIFSNMLLENFNKFEMVFLNIEYCSPEENYAKFCENNKSNEIRRATCSFYTNLMKINVIQKEELCTIILNLFELLNKLIQSKNKNNEIDELSELMYIMISIGYEDFTLDYKNKIYEEINNIANMKVSSKLSLTNKCIFKHMDMLDDIS